MNLIGFIVFTILGTTVAYKSYAGYQVLRTSPLTPDGMDKILPLIDDPRFEFFGSPGLSRPSMIMTSSENVAELHSLLEGMGMDPEVSVSDVETVLEEERAANEAQTRADANRNGSVLTFERYMTFDEIQSYLDEVVSTFPEVASLEQVGTSHEGRPLRVLKLSRGGSKPGVFVDAGIHAAEWLGPPVALYAISQLTGASQELLDLADWYILPVANPDGYVYAWTEDRFWRKNRKPNNGSDCIGVDLNRNFDVAHTLGEGNDTTDPCRGRYRGPSAHSESETKALADFVRDKGQKGKLSLYMAIHAFSQYLLYPFGYKKELPADKVVKAAQEAVAAIKAVRGTEYIAGSIAQLLYLAFGNSQDYAYDVAGVPFAYTWELPPASGVFNGTINLDNFIQPPSEIRPVVEETWEGFKVLLRRATAGQCGH